MTVAVLIFENFETLDVFGPVEILGRFKDLYQIRFYSLSGKQVGNLDGVHLETENLENIPKGVEVFMIPGGMGTREAVNDPIFISRVREIALESRYVLTICTGSAILAKTGLLDGKRATSNKRALNWVVSQGKEVLWVPRARWVVDGKFYTSSGVSAGMDMTLGFLSDRHGMDSARESARSMEYNWQEDRDLDQFALDGNPEEPGEGTQSLPEHGII